ncbi:MAG: S-layer homology domain-containing protein [Defluviitaleaceae bacterium]|nr:S-layer homology domain-containing protein [Defluviitaleaceae bacterium]
MKKFIISAVFAVLIVIANTAQIFARPSDLGFFGGITEGARLPMTTEQIIAQTNANRRAAPQDFVYKEMIFLAGLPVEFEGIMTRRQNGQVTTTADSGSYTLTYDIRPNPATADGVNLTRLITFNVNWRREGNQIIENLTVNPNNTSWRESITVDGTNFVLDPRQSHISISIIRHETPGVTYYRGDISKRAVYTSGGDQVVQEINGRFYGFYSAWSATETHILEGIISTPEWQMMYEVVPSVAVSKDLQYAQNEPTAISFSGNYREVTQNRSGLSYSITVMPNRFYGEPTSGSTTISTRNSFEQLISPDVAFLDGHWAQSDIQKIFSMEILDFDPRLFFPDQQITRATYITMLARAARMPLAPPATTTGRANRNAPPPELIFPDVPDSHPASRYITAAYESGLIRGRGQGHFQTDFAITREEAYVLALRILGLTNLGPDPTPVTPFVDDADIGDWARRELYAAERIGLIFPDSMGRLNPREYLSNAEAAALVIRLIDYMRHFLPTDYTENIINFMH